MLDVISGGRLIAGFPVGTSMDMQLLLRREPGHAAREVPRGARPHHQGVGGARAVRVERQVHQAALREPLAAADPEAAPADLDPRPRLDRDLGLLHRPRLQLQLPLVQRLQARAEDDGRLLGAPAKRGADENPYSAAFFQQVCISDTDAACEREWWPHVDYFFNKCLHLYPGMAEAPGLHQRGVAARRRRRAGRQHERQHGHEQDLEGARRAALHRRRLAGDGAPAARGAGALAARRPPRARAPHRLGADRPDEPLDLSLRHRRCCRTCGRSSPSTRTAGGRSRCPRRERARPGGARPRRRGRAPSGRRRHERRRRRARGSSSSAPAGRRSRCSRPATGAPLLFLHGAGGIPAWEGVLPLLARDYHVYAPLLPGFGQSTGLEHLDDQLDLFLHGFDVMEALGLERPYVVGESMGGWIAAEMAALRPKEIGRLALAAPDRPLARRGARSSTCSAT